MTIEPLEAAFRAAWPVERWADVPVVVGVSGGADSVALLRLVVAARRAVEPMSEGRMDEKVIIAHVNYGLRGRDSDEDEQFVAALQQDLGVAGSFANLRDLGEPSKGGEGLEANLRAARYEFFLRVAREHGARYIAVAHTADDQAETILHHVLRGTGLAGLGGMPMLRAMNDAVTLARPLLGVRRSEIVAYLEALCQPWREDATNFESTFTRNRLRNELIPQLAREYNADIVPALVRLGEQAREAHDVVQRAAVQLADRCVKAATASDDAGAVIDCTQLTDENRHVVRELFVQIWRDRDWPRQAMGFAEWDALAAIALGEADQTPTRVFPGNVAAKRMGDSLELKRRSRE